MIRIKSTELKLGKVDQKAFARMRPLASARAVDLEGRMKDLYFLKHLKCCLGLYT